MRYCIYIFLSILSILLGCSKSDEMSNDTKLDLGSNVNGELIDGDSLNKYRNYFIAAPRNVNYLYAVTGSCIVSTEDNPGYILDAKEYSDNTFSHDEFTISVQTSNTLLDSELNTFNGKPACFKYGEYTSTFLNYLDSPTVAYTKVLDSIFYRINELDNNVDGVGGSATQQVYYEYRNDIVKDIVISANVPLFSREPGKDLSDKFQIVLFYMNAIGCPSYIISSENSQVAYAVKKGMVQHISNKLQLYLSASEKLYGVTYEPYESKNINLKEWSKGKYYADPALYIKFVEKPAELPCDVTFTVTLTTQSKKLSATTNPVSLY